jgi:hypothetical protein
MFTFIVNHLLGNIPTWVWPFAAGGGLAVFVVAGIASHIQPVRIYGLVAKPIAFIVFVLGVFFYGGAGVIAVQQQALEEAKQKVALAEQAAADASKKLADSLAANEHLVKGRGYGVKQIITKDAIKINADCAKINDDAWEDYNRAVKNSGSKILGPKK